MVLVIETFVIYFVPGLLMIPSDGQIMRTTQSMMESCGDMQECHLHCSAKVVLMCIFRAVVDVNSIDVGFLVCY